jgi:hypothetical protein
MKNVPFKVVIFSVLFNFSLCASDTSYVASGSHKENGTQLAPFHIIGESLTHANTNNHCIAKTADNFEKAIDLAPKVLEPKSAGRYAPHLAAEE